MNFFKALGWFMRILPFGLALIILVTVIKPQIWFAFLIAFGILILICLYYALTDYLINKGTKS